jgi:dienelactone hydrolase
VSIEIEQGKGYSAARPNDAYLLYRRAGRKDGRVILITPPAGNTAASFYSAFHNRNLGGFWPEQLAQDGRTVLVIDAATTATVNSWANDAAMGGMDDALAWLAARGYPVDRVGLFGWSQGALVALNYLKRHAPALVKCAYLLAPAVSLDWCHQTIDAAGVEAAYNNNYPSAAAGHDPALEPAAYRGLAPIHIDHALNDSLIPIQQSRDFVAAVNDPNVVLAERDTGAQAGHFAVGTQIAIPDPAVFYRQYLDA